MPYMPCRGAAWRLVPPVHLTNPQSQEVRRAHPGPGLWPGPRRQARWAGRGLRRSRVGPEDRFCEAVRNDLRVPLTPEGPARIMRGVPARRPCILSATGALGATLTAWPWCWRARQRDTAGTAGGRSPGCRARQPLRRRARVRRTRRKLPPRSGETPRLNPGRLRRVTLTALSFSLLAPVLAAHG